LTQEGQYLAFDEALEYFGVHFVKQNISGNPINKENLMLQIQSVQAERDRIDLLLSEFVGDHTTAQGERTARSRKDDLWRLAEQPTEAFKMSDPAKHKIFSVEPELTDEGLQRILTCYEIGCKRLNSILCKDIPRTEPRTEGRRAANVKKHKVKDLYEGSKKKQERKNKGKDRVPLRNEPDVPGQGSLTGHISAAPTESQPKGRRETTPDELAILKSLEAYPDKQPPDEVIEAIRQQLGAEWDSGRIRRWWRNNVKKKSLSRHQKTDV